MCLTVLLHNLSPGPPWSFSWPGTLYFILHTFLHAIIIFFSQCMPIPSQPENVCNEKQCSGLPASFPAEIWLKGKAPVVAGQCIPVVDGGTTVSYLPTATGWVCFTGLYHLYVGFSLRNASLYCTTRHRVRMHRRLTSIKHWQSITSFSTHPHPFNGPFSGTTRVSSYQKGKINLDFNEARDSEWQWHQLGHMQVCTSLQTA